MKVVHHDIKKLETEAVIVGFYEDVRPLKGTAGELDWLLCGALSHLVIDGKLRGTLGEVALLTSQGKIPAPKIFMLGLGSKQQRTSESLRIAARTAAVSALGAGVTSAALEYFTVFSPEDEANLRALQEGLGEGAGGQDLAISVVAQDAATYEKLSRLIQAK